MVIRNEKGFFVKGTTSYLKGVSLSEEHRNKISSSNKGRIVSEETRRKLSESNKGNTSAKGSIRSEEYKEKMRNRMLGKSAPTKGRPNLKLRGENNPSWKGGITPENKRIRRSLEYKLWRESVFKRDNFTCQICFVRGAILNADHIKPFALFPELRFDVSNGRTLCLPCHKLTDNYAGKGLRRKHLTTTTSTG